MHGDNETRVPVNAFTPLFNVTNAGAMSTNLGATWKLTMRWTYQNHLGKFIYNGYLKYQQESALIGLIGMEQDEIYIENVDWFLGWMSHLWNA